MRRITKAIALSCVGMTLAVVLYAIHLVISAPLDFQKRVYPARSLISLLNIDCEGNRGSELSEVLRFVIHELDIPSGQVALVNEGRLSRCVVSWDGRWSSSKRVTHGTRFRFASVTKPVVAATVYQAAEDYSFSVEDPLVPLLFESLPASIQAGIQNIHVSHLLSHRSGLDEETVSHAMFVHGQESWCPSQWELLSEKSLSYPPGLGSSYANANYCLLSVLLERKSGESWYQLAQNYFEVERYDISLIPSKGYLRDEVSYDFMNSGFYMEDYYKYNDLESGAPVLGLSGSATGLVRLFSESILTTPLVSEGLLRWAPPPGCDLTTDIDCHMTGFAGYKSASGQHFYIHTGKLYGASSVIVVSELKNVLVWVGNGNMPRASSGSERLVRKVVNLMSGL